MPGAENRVAWSRASVAVRKNTLRSPLTRTCTGPASLHSQ